MRALSVRDMKDIEAEITIWTLPHSATGSVMTVDLEAEDEDTYCLYVQSLKGVPFQHSNPCVNIDYPHERLELDKTSVSRLGALIEKYRFEFDALYYPTKLSSTNYGMQISQGFQKVAVRWVGSEHINNSTIEIYDLIMSFSNT